MKEKEKERVEERYTQWKSLVPVLYDWLANHNLVWPSLSCRFYLSLSLCLGFSIFQNDFDQLCGVVSLQMGSSTGASNLQEPSPALSLRAGFLPSFAFTFPFQRFSVVCLIASSFVLLRLMEVFPTLSL